MQSPCPSRPPSGEITAVRIPRAAPLTVERLLAGVSHYTEDPQYEEREADTIRPARIT